MPESLKYPVAYFPKFSAQILNDTAHILVLIYEEYFHQTAAQVALKLRRRFITIISSAEVRASRRSVSDMTADRSGGIIERKSLIAPILAMTARKPPKGGKSRADEKSALSVRKHGGLCRVSEKRDFITMLVRGKFP